MVEVEELPNHVIGLRRLRVMKIDRLYPNHGDPRVIASGGHGKALLDATIDYIEKMLARAHDEGCLQSSMEDFIGDALARGWVHSFDTYRAMHQMNLGLVHAHYRDRPAPVPAAPAPADPGPR